MLMVCYLPFLISLGILKRNNGAFKLLAKMGGKNLTIVVVRYEA